MRDAFAAEASVPSSQVLVTVTAGSVVVDVEISADASLPPAAAATWVDYLDTALAPSLSSTTSLDSFLASKGVTSVTVESAPTVVVVKPSPMPPPSPSPPPPASGGDESTSQPATNGALGATEWTDHTGLRVGLFVWNLVIIALGLFACCSSLSPCYVKAPPQRIPSKIRGDVKKSSAKKYESESDDANAVTELRPDIPEGAEGFLHVYNTLPPAWKNFGETLLKEAEENNENWKNKKEAEKEAREKKEKYVAPVETPREPKWFELHKNPLTRLVKMEGLTDATINAKNEEATRELLRGVDLRHVLNLSVKKNPLSMQMEKQPMFELSMPQTQLLAFLSHVRHGPPPRHLR